MDLDGLDGVVRGGVDGDALLADADAFLLGGEVCVDKVDEGVGYGLDDAFGDHGSEESGVQVVRVSGCFVDDFHGFDSAASGY